MKILQKLTQKWTNLKTKLVNEPKWVTVLQSTDEFEIRIKKLQLENEDIPVMIFDQRDSSYNAFGYIYLNVPKDYEEVARNLVNLANE